MSLEGLLLLSQPFIEHIARQKRPGDAQDLTQEVLVKVWQCIAGFEGRSSYTTWLRRLTLNLITDKIRHERSMLANATIVEMPAQETQCSDGHDEPFYAYDSLHVPLTPAQADLVRALLDGDDLRDIADGTGLTLKAVRNRFDRIRDKCRGFHSVSASVYV
jgi:RNA polymerase sigma-70 factor (ECF subfamily)